MEKHVLEVFSSSIYLNFIEIKQIDFLKMIENKYCIYLECAIYYALH